MRILLLNYEFPPLGGGAGNATYHIGRELVKMGDEVCVLTSHFKGLPEREVKDGMRIIRVRAWRRFPNKSNPVQMSCYILSSCFYLVRKWKEFNPDISLAFLGIPSGPPACFLKLWAKVPYVVSLRGGDVPGAQPEQLALFHALARPVIKYIWKKARAVVANSRGLAKLALKTKPDMHIKVIPNGVDLETFYPREKNPSGDKPPVNLLFVGRASREKNLKEAFLALRDCLDLSWTFRIVGDGPELKKWKEQTRQNGLEKRVEFLGWKTKRELPGVYQQSDVLVFPSTSEGMPNVVLEAMASALCIVATEIRGNVDLVENRKSGFLYPCGDVEALKKILRELFINKTLLREMGAGARHRSENFSWRRVAQVYKNLFLL